MLQALAQAPGFLAILSAVEKVVAYARWNFLRTLVERSDVERPDRDRYALGSAICPLTFAVRVNVEILWIHLHRRRKA